MDQINGGVIGYGYWGPNLVRNFVEISSSGVVAVADLREERRAHIKACYPQATVTSDYRDFFAMQLHAAVVATPPPSHFSIAKDCLQHDLHVFVEKPLTLSTRDAEELIEIAKARGLVLMVGHTFEYNPAVQMLKKIIEGGELGQIYYVDAVRVSLGLFQRGLNVLWDLAPHDISILRYILGRDPVSVGAWGAAHIVKGTEDIAYLQLTFPDGIIAHMHVSWLDPCKVRRITVVGSRKMVVYDDVEPLEKIRIYDKGVEAPPYTDTFGDFQCSYRYGDVVIPHIRFTEPLRLECQHFLDCIANGQEPRSSGRVGLKVVKVLEMAERSLRNGGVPERILPEENYTQERILIEGDYTHERVLV
jgi:predicted dehydrogenase